MKKEKKPLPGPSVAEPYRLKQPVATAKFKFRIGQLVWTEHKIYGWLRGKIEAKWDFEGKPHYQIVILEEDGKTVRMLTTASEAHFFKERP